MILLYEEEESEDYYYLLLPGILRGRRKIPNKTHQNSETNEDYISSSSYLCRDSNELPINQKLYCQKEPISECLFLIVRSITVLLFATLLSSLIGCVQCAVAAAAATTTTTTHHQLVNSRNSEFNNNSSTLLFSGVLVPLSECETVMSNLDKVLIAASQSSSSSDPHYYHQNSGVNQQDPTATTQFSSSSSSPNNKQICPSNKNSSSSSHSCCLSTLIPRLLHSQSSNLLLQTFNNSFKYNTFRTQITAHLKLITETRHAAADSSNKELWNATIDGLNVLKDWGVKYWDPLFLYSNRVFSNECLSKVVGNWVCHACGGGVGGDVRTVKPCKSLCHNTVTGCLKSPLAEYIEQPWKHAVNSVRTAVRLVMTTGGGAIPRKELVGNNIQPLQDLVNDLNDWREPITWWLDEYKSSRACEGLPSDRCWNGGSVGKYDSPTATWRSSYNPEFASGLNGRIDPVVTVELDRFRNELVFVRRTLEKFWPTATSSTPHHQIRSPHALPLSSMEDISTPRRMSSSSNPHQNLIPYEGSGDSFSDSDDEDLEYSGNGGHIVDETDDEDLIDNYGGSGSGDGGDYHHHGGNDLGSSFNNNNVDSNNNNRNKNDRPPVDLQSGGSGSLRVSLVVGGLLCIFTTVFR